jgi:hypothetical protein
MRTRYRVLCQELFFGFDYYNAQFPDLESLYDHSKQVGKLIESVLSPDELKVIQDHYSRLALQQKKSRRASRMVNEVTVLNNERLFRALKILKHPENLSKIAHLLGLKRLYSYLPEPKSTRIIYIYVEDEEVAWLLENLQARNSNFIDLRQVATMKASDIRKFGFNNIGPRTVQKLRALLQKHGLDFVPEEE